MRFRSISMAIAVTIMLSATGTALSAEPIEGKWLRPSTDTLVTYAKQGSEYCGTVENGEYKGQSIGCMSGSGNNYKGKVVALDEGKTYSGKATIDGDSMKLEGCDACWFCAKARPGSASERRCYTDWFSGRLERTA